MFDLEIKYNCCNCVSFTLYITSNKISKLFGYLYSLRKSLDNIANNLDGFIARFYLDYSIFECIFKSYASANKDFVGEFLHHLKYILKHPKAEIYIYFCKEFITNKLPVAKNRTLRFLPILSDDVNVCVIREADGFVSYLDCHNIKLFTTSNKIAMIYEISQSLHPHRSGYNGLPIAIPYDELSLEKQIETTSKQEIPEYLIKHLDEVNMYNKFHYSKWLNFYEEYLYKYNVKNSIDDKKKL